jgi:hypothetical protein
MVRSDIDIYVLSGTHPAALCVRREHGESEPQHSSVSSENAHAWISSVCPQRPFQTCLPFAALSVMLSKSDVHVM